MQAQEQSRDLCAERRQQQTPSGAELITHRSRDTYIAIRVGRARLQEEDSNAFTDLEALMMHGS